MSEVLQQDLSYQAAADQAAAFENQFGDNAAAHAAEQAAFEQQFNPNAQAEQEVQMVVGFDPQLVSMFMRADRDSELSGILKQLLIADLVVNNAVAYGLTTADLARQEAAYHHYKKDEDSVDA